MYKMGVMTTLLTGLTVLALKGLTIGVILLFFAFGKIYSRVIYFCKKKNIQRENI